MNQLLETLRLLIIPELERIWNVSLDLWSISLRRFEPGRRNLGLTSWCKGGAIRKIKLYTLNDPNIFIQVVVHEFAHACDFERHRGPRRDANGRMAFHDSTFRGILREIERVHPEWVQDTNGSLARFRRKS